MKANSHIFDKGNCLSEEQKLAYIAGTLRKGELHKVEKHLLMCEMCADEIEGLKLLGIDEATRIAKEVNAEILEITNPSRTKKTIPLKRMFAYAALLLLLFGLGTLIKTLIEPNVTLKQISQNEGMSIPSPEISQNKDIATDELAFAEKSTKVPIQKANPKTTTGQQKENEEIAYKPEEINSQIKEPLNKVSNEDLVSTKDDAEIPAPVIYESEMIVEEDIAVAPQSAKKEAIMVHDDTKREEKKSKARSSAPAQGAVSDEVYAAETMTEQNLSTQVRLEFNAKNYHSVISLLSALNKNLPDYYEMQWLLAKSYNELNEKEKCKKILQEIIISESPYKKEAQNLLEKIK